MGRNPFKVPTADRTLEDWRNIARFFERRDANNRKLLENFRNQFNGMKQRAEAHFSSMPHTSDERNWND